MYKDKKPIAYRSYVITFFERRVGPAKEEFQAGQNQLQKLRNIFVAACFLITFGCYEFI